MENKIPTPREIEVYFKSQTYEGKPMPFYVEYIDTYEPIPKVIRIWVNGDWKHDHGYCDYLMGTLGFAKMGEEQLAPSDSDWYYSVHNYIFTGEIKK